MHSSEVILNTVEEEGHPIVVDHPSEHDEWLAFRYSDQFVDNQSNGSMYPCDDAEECTCKLEINVNLSNSLLNTSGGGDNFQKSFCYIVEQVPGNGR